MATEILIYTKDPCPYCERALRLLEEKKFQFKEIDLTGKPEEIDRIKNETGWRTVPIIIIGGKLVGGYNDLKALDDEGKLDGMVKA